MIFRDIKTNGDKFKITHYEKVPENLYRGNYELRKDERNVRNLDKDSSFERLVARIPLITYLDWYKKYPELQDSELRDKFLLKLLSNSENKVFRTVENI